MKVFVTGATGVIGVNLIPALIKKGHIVGGMTTNNRKVELLQSLGATAYVGNVLKKEQVQAILQDFQPDIVIHQVTALSNGSVLDNAKVRTIGTRHIIDVVKKLDVKRMIAQSIAWAYEPGETIATEEDSLDIQAMGKRKITIDGIVALENAVQEIPNSIILRYGSLYGPGTWYDKNGMIAKQCINSEMAVNDGITSFIHVKDAVNATIQAIGWANGTYNIVDDEPVKSAVWGSYYAEQLHTPSPNYIYGKMPWERGASNQKAKKEGWKLLYPTWRNGFLTK
ncbi:NAD-dependent epimerase/dehydratase family protein [Bacillus sp. NPDC094106]|uniref:NAD-dependent epimerase/dehydratase family protein n=1 Tax=Bacillus sp. NPDC094106 TaxID=3363949 RepID=UPI0038063315